MRRGRRLCIYYGMAQAAVKEVGKMRLVMDGNAFYEVDEECLAKKEEQEKKEEKEKKQEPDD